MRNEELKRCPFCGGSPKVATRVFNYIVETAYVYCDKCGAQTEEVSGSAGYSAEEKAADLWNHRIEPHIVLCKECKHWLREFGDLGTCDSLLADTHEDNYCRNGIKRVERK